jgi:hypothetical protein
MGTLCGRPGRLIVGPAGPKYLRADARCATARRARAGRGLSLSEEEKDACRD